MGRRARIGLGLSVLTLVLASGCRFTSAPAVVPANAAILRVTATPSGCPPIPSRVRAGPVELVVTNLDAPAVDEVEIRTANFARVLGERENLVVGMTARVPMTLARGDYLVNCPGAARSHWSFQAVGTG